MPGSLKETARLRVDVLAVLALGDNTADDSVDASCVVDSLRAAKMEVSISWRRGSVSQSRSWSWALGSAAAADLVLRAVPLLFCGELFDSSEERMSSSLLKSSSSPRDESASLSDSTSSFAYKKTSTVLLNWHDFFLGCSAFLRMPVPFDGVARSRALSEGLAS